MSTNPPADRSLHPANTLQRLPSRRRLWLFRGMAVSLPFLVLLAIEGVLRLSHGHRPTHFFMPSPDVPGALAANWMFSWRYFPPALARAQQPLLAFPKKEAGTKRIVILGSSAAMGDPDPTFGLGRHLQALLEPGLPVGSRIEVVNAAMTAINSHVTRDAAKDLARDLEADAWVVLMGNNEFNGPFGPGSVFGRQAPPLPLARASVAFRTTALGQWFQDKSQTLSASNGQAGSNPSWRGMEMFLEQKLSPDDPRLERVYSHFRQNLDAVLGEAADHQLPVVVCTVPVNLRDCPPFASVHQGGIAPPGWELAFQRGGAALGTGNYVDAIEPLEQAAELAPGHAESHYRLGQAREGVGDRSGAASSFSAARNYDALKFRADARLNQIIRDRLGRAQASSPGSLYLVDAEHLFATAASGAAPGREFFHEHVHFTFDGTQALARPVAEVLRQVLGVPQNVELPTPEQVASRLGWTADHEIRLLTIMRRRLQQPPFNGQSNDHSRQQEIAEAIDLLRKKLTPATRESDIKSIASMLQVHGDDWQLRQNYAAALDSAGRTMDAAAEWRRIAAERPHYTHDFQLGSLLSRTKQYDEAEVALRSAITRRPDYARPWNSLGIVRSQRGALEEACEHFARALKVDPGFAEAHYNWGLVLMTRKLTAEAAPHFDSAAHLEPDNVAYRYQAGQVWMQLQEPSRVEPHYAAVARLSPLDTPAQINHAGILLRLQRPVEAIPVLERVLGREPGNDIARKMLVKCRAATPAAQP